MSANLQARAVNMGFFPPSIIKRTMPRRKVRSVAPSTLSIMMPVRGMVFTEAVLLAAALVRLAFQSTEQTTHAPVTVGCSILDLDGEGHCSTLNQQGPGKILLGSHEHMSSTLPELPATVWRLLQRRNASMSICFCRSKCLYTSNPQEGDGGTEIPENLEVRSGSSWERTSATKPEKPHAMKSRLSY